MPRSSLFEGPGSMGVIPIHFDIERHSLPLAVFIETARHTQTVIDNFSRELFEDRLAYEIFVFPPSEVTFLTKLGLALAAGGTVIWTFTASDVGKAFVKGLTNHEPSYFAEAAGSYLRDQGEQWHRILTYDPAASVRTELFENIYGSIVVVEMTKSFLQKESEALKCAGVSLRKFREAYGARNEFYQVCAAEQEIRAVGFDEKPKFPIKRADFAQLQVSLPPKEEQPVGVRWEVEIVTLKVTSPNWDRADDKRPWKAKDYRGLDRYFRIDDEEFWSRVGNRSVNTSVADVIEVQWAFIGSQRRSARVLRVLAYNGEKLAKPLDDNALAAILGAYHRESGGADLFR